MSRDFSVIELKEGIATIRVPLLEETGEHIDFLRSQAPVFFNPRMRFNRDIAVLALKIHSQELGKPVTACEPLCGCGVRGIRFALETNVNEVIIGDLSPSAIKLAEENAFLNGVQGKVHARLMDANFLLSLHSHPGGRFDYVDIDPYGAPVTYLDSAIRATKNHGMIALTATDLAPLCGRNPKASLRKYGGFPLQSNFCHEIALRIMVGAFGRQAAVHESEVKLLFSYYADHYIRVYATIHRGAKLADKALEKLGFIHFCPECLYREASKKNSSESCPNCSRVNIKTAGPLWLGELSSRAFCEKMISFYNSIEYEMDKRLPEFIYIVKNEIGYPPTYYLIDELCSFIGVKSMPTDIVTQRIKLAGYNVSRTHFDQRGIKTDASINELLEILK
jgi:tRNA (guanine26-N2/guanine27-N2)-dimethyltransferase